MIMSRAGGHFKGIEFEKGFEKNNLLDVYCVAHQGDDVRPYKNTTDSLGTIIFKADSVDEMIKITSNMHEYYQVLVD